jgi:hypothetical protein
MTVTAIKLDSVNGTASHTLSRLIESYQTQGKVDVNDAYDFVSALSSVADDSIEAILPIINELAELDISKIMRSAGNALMTHPNLDRVGVPVQVLAITYFVIADSLDKKAIGTLH